MACCTGCLIFKCLTKFEDTPTFPRNGRLFGAQNWQRASLIPSLWETTLKYFPLNNKPSKKITMFENYSKCHIWIVLFWHFPPIFVLLKVTCLVTLFDRKLQVFKNSPKLTIFGIFHELLSTQNINVARFARKCKVICGFQTQWQCNYVYVFYPEVKKSKSQDKWQGRGKSCGNGTCIEKCI